MPEARTYEIILALPNTLMLGELDADDLCLDYETRCFDLELEFRCSTAVRGCD